MNTKTIALFVLVLAACGGGPEGFEPPPVELEADAGNTDSAPIVERDSAPTETGSAGASGSSNLGGSAGTGGTAGVGGTSAGSAGVGGVAGASGKGGSSGATLDAGKDSAAAGASGSASDAGPLVCPTACFANTAFQVVISATLQPDGYVRASSACPSGSTLEPVKDWSTYCFNCGIPTVTQVAAGGGVPAHYRCTAITGSTQVCEIHFRCAATNWCPALNRPC